jgi:ribonuclease HI
MYCVSKRRYVLSCGRRKIMVYQTKLIYYRITSKLVWDCHQSLIQLAKHNKVQLIWLPDHKGIVGNDTVHQLARTGPEPACGISTGVAKRAVRDWTNRNHKELWETVTGLR